MNILLLRESKGTLDEYHLHLSTLGNVASIPVLTFEFDIENLLKEVLW